MITYFCNYFRDELKKEILCTAAVKQTKAIFVLLKIKGYLSQIFVSWRRQRKNKQLWYKKVCLAWKIILPEIAYQPKNSDRIFRETLGIAFRSFSEGVLAFLRGHHHASSSW